MLNWDLFNENCNCFIHNREQFETCNRGCCLQEFQKQSVASDEDAGSLKISNVLNWYHPYTEIFSKRRKIYAFCVGGLSLILPRNHVHQGCLVIQGLLWPGTDCALWCSSVSASTQALHVRPSRNSPVVEREASYAVLTCNGCLARDIWRLSWGASGQTKRKDVNLSGGTRAPETQTLPTRGFPWVDFRRFTQWIRLSLAFA